MNCLASEFRSKSIWERIRHSCPELTRAGRKRLELGAGEAEVVAVAVKRRWTLLLNDQAAVNLVRCLYPEVPILPTCELLYYAG
jgi:predicted nucleic acid-binding protein